jgi:hypothetical protein
MCCILCILDGISGGNTVGTPSANQLIDNKILDNTDEPWWSYQYQDIERRIPSEENVPLSATKHNHYESNMTAQKNEVNAIVENHNVKDYTTHKHWHDGNSPMFWTFFWPKLQFFLLSCTLTFLKYCLRYPVLLGIPYSTVGQKEIVDQLFLLCNIGIRFCSISWMYWIYGVVHQKCTCNDDDAINLVLQAYSRCVDRFDGGTDSSIYVGKKLSYMHVFLHS